jgi:hypothetical protein
MMLRRVIRQADVHVSIYAVMLIAGMFLIAGCGSGDDGTDGYSQDFPAPEGAIDKPVPSRPVMTRAQRRRQEIEEDRKEAAAKPKRRRSRP